VVKRAALKPGIGLHRSKPSSKSLNLIKPRSILFDEGNTLAQEQ